MAGPTIKASVVALSGWWERVGVVVVAQRSVVHDASTTSFS